MNTLKLPFNTLKPEKNYIITVEVAYMSYTGKTTIRYFSEKSTDYSLTIEPITGVALSTEFTLAVVTQSLGFEINEFLFGYQKSGVKYYLTKSSPNPIHTVILPEGETSSILKVFVEIYDQQGREYYIEKEVTVTAPTLLASTFNNIINKTNPKAIEESVRILLQYEHLKDSLSASYKKKAVDLIFNGLLKDGQNIIDSGFEGVKETVAESLAKVSADFQSLGNSDLVIRATNIFYQTFYTENLEMNTTGMALEIDGQAVENAFRFVDNVISQLEIVNATSQEGVKIKLQKAMEYILRGSIANLAPGDTPLTKKGTSFSLSASKINVYSVQTNTTIEFIAPDGNTARITVPRSALGSHQYVQLIAFMAKVSFYHTKAVNSGSSLKTGMMTVIMAESEGNLAVGNTKLKSKSLIVTNLTDRIEIEIPYSEKVNEKMVLSCAYSSKSGDTISSTGITTI